MADFSKVVLVPWQCRADNINGYDQMKRTVARAGNPFTVAIAIYTPNLF